MADSPVEPVAATDPRDDVTQAAEPVLPRFRRAGDYVVLALLAFIPMLATQPGTVSDDTKTYLYLDPGRYVRQAVSLWDPNVALGTVTHENIGYLLPMGPFYWALAELHVPLWVAQRLWLGTVLFAAGAGMLYLCRTLKLSGAGCYVASFAFMFAPYVLQYSGRISIILLPWSGLPWMLAFVILALRHGGWKYPALFALVVAIVSGINASSILYVGIGPALWLPFSVYVLRDSTWRQAWRVAWRTGILSLLVSLWWIIGLQVEAAYGVNILKYTETLVSTSSSSSPFEVLRGLGYWFFYGRSDQTGNWTQAAVAYTQQIWLLILSFFVPFLALLASALLKWRKRSFFALLVVVGMALAVGAYPYYHPTGVSGLIKAFMSDTTAGLALRSTDRATPLLLLGLAVLLGAGVDAVVRRFGRSGLMAAAFVLVAIAGASFPLWTGSTVVDGLHQPAQPPSYVKEAASALNASHPGTRVYGMPGNNFGAYRWGDTIDTVYPGLLTRPFVTHEQQTMGSLPTADLLEAVDTPLQEGTMDPRTIAPMMSLMSVGDVLVQYDQAYETYNTPNPLQLAYDLTPTPAGLSDPVSYGKPRANVSTVPDFDEQLLALPVNQKPTAPLVSYTVAKPRPIVRAESLKTPLVVDGDSTGLVNASSVGLLANQPTVFFAGTLDTNSALKKSVLKPGANLVVTDTNRKQGYRWNGIQDNAGYTETAAETTAITNLLTPDPFNSPLNLFPKAPADAQSTTVFNDDIAWVEASSYGSLTQYFNDERPAAALDGDPATAWADSQFPTGQWWSVEFSHPKTMGSINLAQIQAAHPKQVITKVTLSFDYENPVTVELGAESRTPTGQTIDFSPRTFSNLRITIDASYRTKYHVTASYENVVGFSEVRFPSLPAVTETVAMPQDLLRSVGATSTADPLTLSMTRLRGSGFPERYDAELAIDRSFWLPTTRTFALTGQARIDATSSDETVDHDVGRPDAQGGGVSASSSSRLTGDVATGASAAIDGDPSTTWTSAFGVSADGQWLQYSLARPITFDSLDLQIVADGRHSVPTEVTVSAGGVSDKAKLAPVADGKEAGTIVKVPVALPTALTGQTIRVTIDAARMETTKDYYTQSPITKPFAVAELGIEGLASSPVPTAIPSTCRDDLLSVDGAPVWVAVSGSSTTALARRPLSIALCGPDAGGLALGPGSHTLRSARGQVAGFNLDTVDLSSAAGGGPAVISAEGDVPVAVPAVAPKVTVDHQTSTAMRLTISHIPAESSAFDLVLGQSINSGWQASIAGQSLGTPFLVDGFANGWQVDPSVLGSADHTGTVTVSLKWAPQKRVNIALIISALVIVACLLLAFVPRRRRRHARRGGDISPPGIDRSEAGGSVRMAVDEEPTLAPLFRSDEAPARWVSATVIAVLVGLAAGLIAPPLTGVFVGVATLVVLRVPRLRLVLGLVAAGLVLIAAAYIVIEQVLHSTLPNGGWPTDFGQASAIVWAGIMFLMADAVIEVVNRRRAGDPHRELPEDSVGHDYEDPVSRR